MKDSGMCLLSQYLYHHKTERNLTWRKNPARMSFAWESEIG